METEGVCRGCSNNGNGGGISQRGNQAPSQGSCLQTDSRFSRALAEDHIHRSRLLVHYSCCLGTWVTAGKGCSQVLQFALKAPKLANCFRWPQLHSRGCQPSRCRRVTSQLEHQWQARCHSCQNQQRASGSALLHNEGFRSLPRRRSL